MTLASTHGQSVKRRLFRLPEADEPMTLQGKKLAIIGGSRGLGRTIAEEASRSGCDVLATARSAPPLAALKASFPAMRTMALDATVDDAPTAVFSVFEPDILVVCIGIPRTGVPLQRLEWKDFSATWDTDVKASCLFCKAALTLPLRPGATVILISSGAAIGGSPISGGYAGAKRMQMFMADYAQKESDRAALGLRFLALAPMRPMIETDGGQAAVNAYAAYLDVPPRRFAAGPDGAQTVQQAARAVLDLAARPRGDGDGNVFIGSATGLEPLP